MEINGALFSSQFLWVAGGLYAAALYVAGRLGCWKRLLIPRQSHLFFGTVLMLSLLWLVRAHPNQDLTYHLTGATTLTLMLGWSLALAASSLALVVVTLKTDASWQAFALNAWLVGLVPITLTQVTLVLVRSLLPKQFFIYVLVNGFLTAGLAGLITGYLAYGLLAWSGAYELSNLRHSLLPYFPLMFLPEAMLNGWIITALVVMRPEWVDSFSDKLYLHGK